MMVTHGPLSGSQRRERDAADDFVPGPARVQAATSMVPRSWSRRSARSRPGGWRRA